MTKLEELKAARDAAEAAYEAELKNQGEKQNVPL